MSNSDLRKSLIEAAQKLIAASPDGRVDGEDVARHIGRNAGDPEVYVAFREIDRLGELKLEGWGGGMGLPHFVVLPDGEEPSVAAPESRHWLSHYMGAPIRWARSDHDRVVDRIAVLVLGGAILAAIIYFVGFQPRGSTSANPVIAASHPTSAPTPASAAPMPSDGRDPKASRCSPPAENVPGTVVALQGRGLGFGTLVLRHSPACNTAWGAVRGLGPEEKLRLVIVANRPSDHATTSYAQFGGFNAEGVYGNELLQTHGCVLAIAAIEHNGQTLARARTPCR